MKLLKKISSFILSLGLCVSSMGITNVNATETNITALIINPYELVEVRTFSKCLYNKETDIYEKVRYDSPVTYIGTSQWQYEVIVIEEEPRTQEEIWELKLREKSVSNTYLVTGENPYVLVYGIDYDTNIEGYGYGWKVLKRNSFSLDDIRYVFDMPDGKILDKKTNEVVMDFDIQHSYYVGPTYNGVYYNMIYVDGQKEGYFITPNDVTRVSCGDCNGDLQIDLTDLTELSLHLMGEKISEVTATSVIDINGDKAVNIADLAHLKQYIMGEDVKLG